MTDEKSANHCLIKSTVYQTDEWHILQWKINIKRRRIWKLFIKSNCRVLQTTIQTSE